MKRHLITVLILFAALIFYAAGMSGVGAIAFVAGAGFETWFWIRACIKPRRRKSPPYPSGA